MEGKQCHPAFSQGFRCGIVAKDPAEAAAAANDHNNNNKDKAAPFVHPIDSKCSTAVMDVDPFHSIGQAEMRSRSSRMCGYLHPAESNMLEQRRLHSCQRNCYADRLMSKTPAKDLYVFLIVDFKPEVPNWGGKRMTLNSVYSLTVALKMGGEAKLSQVVGKDVTTTQFLLVCLA